MKWFGKKEDEDGKKDIDLQRLPELPRLPNLPKMRDDGYYDDLESDIQDELPKLPSFPNTGLGRDFSRSAIKGAVSGEKEGEEDFADDSFHDRMMQKPSGILPKVREFSGHGEEEHDEPKGYPAVRRPRVMEAEPIYIRLDKFNESAKVFESTLGKVNDIQKTLNEVRKIREEEEADLGRWEREIQDIKRQLERIDKDVFSGV
jgi:hypothetical protein